MQKLGMKGRWFVDESGRRVILRGVNLGGDCKVPWPDGGTEHPSDFSDHRTVSFIGRPFPLTEADEHLARLKHWGFNCLRLLTTWEAVEHAGPGQYDKAYLDYFEDVARRAGRFGLYVFVDFHQDVWSRMSGGDGAPGWTFEAVGLDFSKFHAAGAAHVMQHKYDYAKGGRQDAYPQMSWSSNYRLPANAIMWTLFFAGRDMTPDFRIEGRNVQDYLQDHYIGSMRAIAERVKDMPHVIGFDTLNEPGEGWIGEPLTRRHNTDSTGMADMRPGLAISPMDAMLAARGVPRKVPFLAMDRETRSMKVVREETLNPNGVSIWTRDCPFEAAGAYDSINRTAPINEQFFTHRNGRKLAIEADYMNPFFAQVAAAIRAVRDDWMVFAEVSPFRAFAGEGFAPGAPERTVNASHWYDIQTLGSKRFRPKELRDNPDDPAAQDIVAGKYTAQLAHIAKLGDTLGPEGAPTLIGEFGIPYDLDEGEAYAAWASGDRSSRPWRGHELALRLMYEAMDRLLISSTQWNYTAANRNDAAMGDNWNQEDLSIYSRDQGTGPNDPDSGGRAVKGFSRPYARRIQGEPTSAKFDAAAGTFTLVFNADPAIDAPTEIYVPTLHFPRGAKVDAPGCKTVTTGQLVELKAETAGPKIITVSRL
ncbi:MAG TPA: cellulase family glycosylhydrolase [Rhizomicrobium sp.]